jgi:RNA ligase (TIGR02306 family)
MEEKMQENTNRKLATIGRIESLALIEGADAIEKATVRGWDVVVKKGDFSPDDLCVYCEIDSVLPEREEFEFLRKNKFRIKSIRLRGQLSQGIIFPLSILGKVTINRNIVHGDKGEVSYMHKTISFIHNSKAYYLEEGDDVTEILGVTKYEPPVANAQLAGDAKGNFPAFIPKTDEERIQNMKNVIVEKRDIDFYVTEKLDGSSCTIYCHDGEFGVCSRNLELKETEGNVFWKIVRRDGFEEKLRGYGRDIALQGEVVGPGIQKNKYGLHQHELYVYNVFDIKKDMYLSYPDLTDVVDQLMVKMVPLIDDHFRLPNTLEELIGMADGYSALCKSSLREGIVVRPTKEMVRSKGGRLSFKVVSNKFLLKHGE